MRGRLFRALRTGAAAGVLALGLASAAIADPTTTYGYDALGRLTSVIYPDGQTINYAYDAAGNRTQLTPIHNPVANADAGSTPMNTAATLSVLANDTDSVSGHTLTISSVTTPGHGSTSIVTGSTQVQYTPATGYIGADSFTYTISDGHSGTATATVSMTVTSINHAPVANTDSVTTAYNTAATNIAVRSNDTDADGDTLTITSATNGSHGAVTVNSGTTVTYTPTTGYSGSDSFTYTISDGHGGTATGTVNVTVSAPTNVAPVANDDSTLASATYTGGGLVRPSSTFDPRANDTDADGDTLSVSSTTNGTYGTVTHTGVSVTYTTNVGYRTASFTDTFTYTISDGHGHTAMATVTVDVEVDDGTGGIGGQL
ncbi:MAG: tandem-95 repeat protein [Proteobacteria bacterium]|nr:tandem-95 repeat protein [Pseudomonadota bacterium]